MLISNYHARIIHLGEVKESNGFKKCYATIETKEKRGEDGDVSYSPEIFECEIALDKEGKKFAELKALESSYFPAQFNLRAFKYIEGKDKQEKLGKQLQLKRWTR